MFNVYAVFKSLVPTKPLQAGSVKFIENGVATIELPGGGIIHARGQAEIDDHVFVRDGVIEGQAANLTRIDQEV